MSQNFADHPPVNYTELTKEELIHLLTCRELELSSALQKNAELSMTLTRITQTPLETLVGKDSIIVPKTSMEQLETRIAGLVKENQSLRSEVLTLRSTVEQDRVDLQHADQRIKVLTTQMEGLQSALESQSTKNLTLSKEMDLALNHQIANDQREAEEQRSVFLGISAPNSFQTSQTMILLGLIVNILAESPQ